MTSLYRIYGTVDERDADGLGPINTRLLYVGITDNYEKRIAQHAEKHWWKNITKVTREEFDERASAAAAEREAIRSERPVHNRVGNAAPPKARAIPKPSKHAAPDPLLRPSEAAEYLGVTDRTIRNYIARGDLPAHRVRGSRLVRVRLSALDALLTPIPSAKGY